MEHLLCFLSNPRFKIFFFCQVDLRDETGVVEKLAKNRQKPITIEHGDKMARELKAGENTFLNSFIYRGVLSK